MGAIKMSGLASGMDTNAIVEKLVEQSKVPITRLENKYELKELEKEIYKSASDKLTTINTSLLTLRMESTFKTKSAESSNNTVLGSTASLNAVNGSYSVVIKQIAENALWSSSFTRARITEKGAGVTGTDKVPNDYLEGKHTVTVSNKGSFYMAENNFKPNEWGTMKKYNGSAISYANADGSLNNSINGNVIFNYEKDGISRALSATVNASSGEDINKVARQIETQINDQINTENNTQGVQYLAVRADYDSSTQQWSLATYKSSIYDYNLSGGAGTVQSDLGVSSFASVTSSSTIKQYYIASDLTTLGQKLNNTDSGLISGVTLMGTGLTEGTFSITQDASLLVASESYSTLTGASGFSPDSSNVLSKKLSDVGATTASNGNFTINGVQIAIDDYSKLTVNDLLAKINASGAGVTASYDQSANKIVLTNNKAGSTAISVGSSKDTSNMLSVMKLTSMQGAVNTTGSTSGSISTTTVIKSAGMSAIPTSGTFTINGVSIYVDTEKDSLDDIIKKVNSSGAGVTMVYDSVRDKISVSSQGLERITFGSAGDTSNFLEAVNLKKSGTATTTESLGSAGQNAIIQVNGITYVRESNSIDDVIAGVTLDVRAPSTTPTTVTVTADTTKATEALATFTKNYNELMNFLNAPTLTKKQKTYLTPLTDEAKKSMSTDEIKEYNQYYKTYNSYDIIRKSSELREMRTSLRDTLFTEISGASNITNLLEIGIDIAGNGDMDIEKKGLLVADSTDYDEILKKLQSNTKLQNTLTNKADDVYRFFSANIIVGNDDSKKEDANGNPIKESNDIKGWSRVYGSLISRYNSYDGSIQRKIATEGTIDQELIKISAQIETQERRSEQELERYWAQFTAMEKAIAEAQKTGNSLSAITGNTSSK